MKKLIILIIFFLLFIPSCFAGVVIDQSAVLARKNVAAGGPTVFFEADWSTNTPGATDELCSVCGGCPDTFDINALANNTAVAGGKLVVTLDSAVTPTVTLDDDAGEFLNGNTLTEYWTEFKIEFNDVAHFAGTLPQIAQSVGHWAVKVVTSAGAITGARLTFYHDAGSSTDTAISWSPLANTQYTLRIHYKIDTDAGADIGGDTGVATLTIVGVGTETATAIDNDAVGVPTNISSVYISATLWDTANTILVSYDDVIIYSTDPSW